MSDVKDINEFRSKYNELKSEISKVIVGQEFVINQILIFYFFWWSCFINWSTWFSKNTDRKHCFKSIRIEI